MLEEFEDAKERIELILCADGKQRYTDLSDIGMGATAVVMKALDNELGIPVAIKSPKESNTSTIKRFRREYEALNQLDSHPNIVCAHDFYGNIESYPILVIELARTNLRSKLKSARKKGSTLGLDYLLGSVPQICDGLDGMRQPGLVHRDVKPSNVLIMDDGIVKLCDLGSLGFIGSRKSSGSLNKATIEYEAPELMENWDENHEDPRVDFYPVGLMMYELLTGRDLIPGLDDEYPSDDALKEHILAEKKKYKSIEDRVTALQVPEHIKKAIKGCVRPKNKRYSSALELKADILGGDPVVVEEKPRPRDTELKGLRQRTLDAYDTYVRGLGYTPIPGKEAVIPTLSAQQCREVLGILQYATRHGDASKADPSQLAAIHSTLQRHREYAREVGV